MTTTIEEVIEAIAALGRVEVQSTNQANGRGISKATAKRERQAVAKLLEICTGEKPDENQINDVIQRMS